ncbi:hypothetical protein [Myxococcus sp. RHSTA-1-4]|uniref:hypothetical protein n=1 Tax=Myxococcus sp. RHSTA-1-4 TaxID=2874601 RepID=UPI001CBE871A|nr:hypothetical protein [Myxococcus sp. RHSTA-1-4]MBZ4420709.1 hypothetical protein [Myxococcus sp. RHSTA-1-4]
MSMCRGWAVVLLLWFAGAGWAEAYARALGAGEEDTSIVGERAVASSEAPAGDAPPAPSPAASIRPGTRWSFLTRMEATVLTLLPRQGAGEAEGFVQVEPMAVVDGGETFGLNLGAPVRLRAWGGGEGTGLVREEDWDSLSDWGQLVRLLSLGHDASPVALWAGSLDCYTLLSGHLVRRYSNRSNPDYHPAGAVLTATAGPLFVESFVSDVLGARLMGVGVELDVQHVLFGQPARRGRYTLGLSAVLDWGRAGGVTREVTLAHVDGTAMVLARRGFELHLLAGGGGRPGRRGAWGAVAGVGADAVSPTLDLLARLEVRRQHGGFRQGWFGPDSELARFQVAGTSGLPLADASFPEGYSAFGELVVGWDAEHLGDLVQRHLRLSLGVEAFTWGRVDADGRLAVQLFGRDVEAAVRGLAVGLRQPGARYLASGEVRWRFLGGRLYAMGQGGTLLYPTEEGTLRPGAFASVGLGVDNAR